MLKKTVKYTDPFSGEEVEEDLYFHLTKAEIVELEVSHEGGLSEWMKKIVVSQDNKQIIAEFKNIILSAYGVRSENGRFVKTQEFRDEFVSSEAYSAFFMDLLTDDTTEKMIEFTTGIMPAGLTNEEMDTIKKELAEIDREENPTKLTPVPDEPEDEPQEVRAEIRSDDDTGKGDN